MYNILLVDDEILALNGLLSMIDWDKHDVSEPIIATSMKQSISTIKKTEIDILICDIQMPNGTGLDLLEWINDHSPDIVTVFLTFHDRFDYAKKALSLGAFEYLLKPTSAEDLESTLVHCIKKVNDIRSSHIKENKTDLLKDNQSLSNADINESDQSQSLVQKAIRYIDNNLDKDLTRKEICDHVYIHQDYLSKIFHNQTGKTISEYIYDKRMELAKDLLKNTGDPIGAICEKVGYSFNSHFSKMFKIKTGVSPQQYRASIKR